MIYHGLHPGSWNKTTTKNQLYTAHADNKQELVTTIKQSAHWESEDCKQTAPRDLTLLSFIVEVEIVSTDLSQTQTTTLLTRTYVYICVWI